MGTAKVIDFPRKGLARPPLGDRRPRRAALQAKANEWASMGYWWGVQDTAPYVPIAFLAGVCFAFAVLS